MHAKANRSSFDMGSHPLFFFLDDCWSLDSTIFEEFDSLPALRI